VRYIYAHIAAVSLYKIIKPRSMPKVELGTFWVVAGEALKIDSRSGVAITSWDYCECVS
jgi:hypothetical protein